MKIFLPYTITTTTRLFYTCFWTFFYIFSARGCPYPEMGNNSHIMNPQASWAFNDWVRYDCEKGYVYQSGSRASHCVYDGTATFWSNDPLNCIRKFSYFHSLPKYLCSWSCFFCLFFFIVVFSFACLLQLLLGSVFYGILLPQQKEIKTYRIFRRWIGFSL